jgi:hypothetical protein
MIKLLFKKKATARARTTSMSCQPCVLMSWDFGAVCKVIEYNLLTFHHHVISIWSAERSNLGVKLCFRVQFISIADVNSISSGVTEAFLCKAKDAILYLNGFS